MEIFALSPGNLFNGGKILNFSEILFPYPANRAEPILRQVFEAGAFRYTACRIPDSGIIHIVADETSIS